MQNWKNPFGNETGPFTTKCGEGDGQNSTAEGDFSVVFWMTDRWISLPITEPIQKLFFLQRLQADRFPPFPAW